ncbi:MAG: hypothetical protein LBR36_06145 [Bacteroidales bacterium]|jgi:hypothetical protein|nr:hypothetical protein [Bacteroidales bacterium]
MNILKIVLRILLGCFFIATAVLKLFSLDEFEIYIYSFNICNFVLSTVVARLLIAAEFLLGMFLILRYLYKWTWFLTLLFLLAFTGLLFYTAIFRNDSNCHCMGAWIELNPLESIIKNVLCIAILFFIRKQPEHDFIHKLFTIKYLKKIIIGLTFAAAIIVPFGVVPMDSVYNFFRSEKKQVNEEAFALLQKDSTFAAAADISNGNYITAMVLSRCKYCKLSTEKITQIVDCHQLDKSRLIFAIWGDSLSVEKFKEVTHTQDYTFAVINPYIAIDVTFGSFPLFIYTQNGKITQSVDFRELSETEIVKLLQ